MINLENITPDVLAENFSFLDNWEDKYRYLIELGDSLPPFNPADRTPENRVDGCMSQVWMTHTRLENGRHIFKMDSDAHIVRGLQAVLLIHINNRTTDEIHTCALNTIFEKLGLGEHLSGTRRNGFAAMIDRIYHEII